MECAVLGDESSPALEFLESLRHGTWTAGDDEPDPPADEQLVDRAVFLQMAKRLADTGMPTGGRSQTRDLDDGIWEFKRDRMRLSWFDTDGTGQFLAKPRIRDRKLSPYPDDDSWWFPAFDEFIRLGHAFPKQGETAGNLNIEETLKVRVEDIQHDITETHKNASDQGAADTV